MKQQLFHLACSLSLITTTFFYLNPPTQAESLRGMTSKQDMRLGPVFHGGITLGQETPRDRQLYSFELRGESPGKGFSRLFFRGINLERPLDLEPLTETGTTRTLRYNQQFFTVGFESAAFYEWTSPLNLEVGWGSGLTLAKVVFKDTQQAKTLPFNDYPEITPENLGVPITTNVEAQGTQFMGGELGIYSRYYQFYPLVPYISGRLIGGNFFDEKAFINGTVEENTSITRTTSPQPTPTPSSVLKRRFQSKPTLGAMGAAGIDLYLFSRGVLGLEYSYWLWDFDVPQDGTHTLVIKSGFLF